MYNNYCFLRFYCYSICTKFNVVPSLTELRISSSPSSPIRPIGARVTINCSCDIAQSLPTRYIGTGVVVTVSISLRNPSGRLLATTSPVVNGSMYTSSAVVNSFERDQSGVYTCTASVRASSLFITTVDTFTTKRITSGKVELWFTLLRIRVLCSYGT